MTSDIRNPFDAPIPGQSLLLLKSGVSIEALTKGILFSGFAEGKWTPDLAVLLAEIVFNQIMAIGMKAKIEDMRVMIGDHTNTLFKRDLADFTVKKDREKNITKIKEDVEEIIEQPKMGLMAGGQ